MIDKSNSRVCVSAYPIGEDNLQLGPMLCQTLGDLGFSPDLVNDGDPGAMKSDILLLVGDGTHFDGFTNLLSNCGPNRPLTIFWLIDPLPPPQLSERGRQIGLKLLNCDWQKLRSPWPKLIRTCLPFHHEMQKAARWLLNRKIKKQALADNCPGYSEIRTQKSYILMKSFEWTKRNFEQGWIDYVFTTTIPRMQTLKTIGIDAGFIPVGYHPSWGKKLSLERDIDVLSIGSLKIKRRRSMLKDLGKKLSAKGIKLQIIDKGCYGEQRTALLNRTRIVLDIPNIPWEMAGMRFLMSISCGALVVSEYVEETAPYKPGVHFVRAKFSELPDAICHYMEHEDQRQAIVNSAYKFVTQELTMKNSLLRIMETCCANTTVQTRSI
ncbi:MAG: glycosyltransferase [Sedimentisphaerales bacterium]|jgi:hypothetical protein